MKIVKNSFCPCQEFFESENYVELIKTKGSEDVI